MSAPGHHDESPTATAPPISGKDSDVHLPPPLSPQTECEVDPTYAEPMVPSSLTVPAADRAAYEDPKGFQNPEVYCTMLSQSPCTK